jgi:hypothetical protein
VGSLVLEAATVPDARLPSIVSSPEWPLIRGSRAGLRLALTLPSIGGILGIWGSVVVHRNPFSVLHAAIDAVVVSLLLG